MKLWRAKLIRQSDCLLQVVDSHHRGKRTVAKMILVWH